MSVQFSGGEPTLSPYFLDAVRYARKVGYNSVQAATNGIEFAKSFEFCQQAVEAGMRYAYLQFDGIRNAANDHRAVGNLFDVKLKAIDNLHKAGCEIVPVVTIVNGINNEQSDASYSSRSTIRRRSGSSASSQFHSPGATRRSRTNAGKRSATRWLIWRTM